MESITNVLLGYVQLEITGQQPVSVLNLCSRHEIPFWNAVSLNEHTMSLMVNRRSLARLRQVAQEAAFTVKVKKRRGAPYFLRRLKRRYTLLSFLFICLMALMLSSFYVWEIDVTGNEKVSKSEILNVLEEVGVGIGSFWPSFTSDNIRSLALVKIPELSWLTVNVRGSKAQVIVRERVSKPEILDEGQPADIVAEKAGIIDQMRVYRGSPVAHAGETVLPGELLVESRVVSPLAGERYQHAMADVLARTWYEITVSTPAQVTSKDYKIGKDVKYALVVGNRRINFYFNGRIIDATCDKIITENHFSLAGVFSLPLTLVKEQFLEYDTVSAPVDARSEQTRLQQYLYDHLLEQIGDGGEVISTSYSASESENYLYVTIRAECLENISQTVRHDSPKIKAEQSAPKEDDLSQ